MADRPTLDAAGPAPLDRAAPPWSAFMPTPCPYPHSVPVDLMEPNSGRAAGDRVPCHLFMPEVAWPEPVGPVLRADRGGGVAQLPVMHLAALWSKARAVHPDDPARQNQSFMDALGVFAGFVIADHIARSQPSPLTLSMSAADQSALLAALENGERMPLVPWSDRAASFADAAQGLQRSCAEDYDATYVVRYTSCPSCGGSVAFRVEQDGGSGSAPTVPVRYVLADIAKTVDEFDQRPVAQVTMAAGICHHTEFKELFYADRPPLRAGDMLYAKRITRKPVTVCEQLIASKVDQGGSVVPVRYVLCPDRVTSSSDGDVHYVGAEALADLYGVRLSDCLVMPSPYDDRPSSVLLRKSLQARVDGGELFALRPRYDRDYRLPAVPPKPPAVRPGQRGGYLVEALFFALGVALLLSSMLLSLTRPDRPLDSTDAPTGQRSEMAVRVDALTGCQYLADVRGGLTPRLGPDGRQLCGAGVPR